MGNKIKLPFIVILYRILILFYLCWGAHAWFTWWIDFLDKNETLSVNIIVFLIAEMYRRKMSIPIINDKSIVSAILCLILGQVTGNSFGPLLIPSLLLRMYPIYILLCDEKNSPAVLSFLVNTIAIILVPGLILHFYNQSVGLPPSIPSIYGDSLSYIFFNYGFMLQPIADYESDSGRFFSIFIEPGYLGVLLAFLLYASKFDMRKKQTWILLVGLFASFSLSGIMSSVIGYIFVKASKNMPIKKVVVFLLLLMPVYFVGLEYNGGDNKVNELIIQRLQPDEEKGFSGNNRVGELFDIYFEQMIEDGSILTGMGIDKANKLLSDDNGMIHGAGYKRYFVINGLLSGLFFFLFYFFMGPGRPMQKNKRYLWGLYVMFIISFLPLGYPLSTTWLVGYALGYANDTNNNAIYK